MPYLPLFRKKRLQLNLHGRREPLKGNLRVRLRELEELLLN